jgi:hypothetical protein
MFHVAYVPSLCLFVSSNVSGKTAIGGKALGSSGLRSGTRDGEGSGENEGRMGSDVCFGDMAANLFL